MDRFWLGSVIGFGVACALNGSLDRPSTCATVPDIRRELIEVVPAACRLAATEAFKAVFTGSQGKATRDAQ